MAGEALVSAAEKVAQEHERVWEQFRKWLEQQTKGTVGALILLIIYGVKDGVIYWKNRPQIIELDKDSPMDAVTKASIMALEKDKVIDSAVLKMNSEVNKMIRRIAKRAGIDVVMQEVSAANGDKALLVAYAGKSKEQLEHFIKVLESYPVIRNALLLTPELYNQLAEMTEVKKLQLKEILAEYALTIAKNPNVDLKILREETAKKIKDRGLIDYDDPSSPINYAELASSKGFLASIEKRLKQEPLLESTISFDSMSKAEQQHVENKIYSLIYSLSEEFASRIATSYNLSKSTDMQFYHKEVMDLLKQNASEPQVASALEILSKHEVLSNPFHSVYEAIDKAMKESQEVIAKTKGSKKDKQKAIALGVASVLTTNTFEQLDKMDFKDLVSSFQKAIKEELTNPTKKLKVQDNAISLKKGKLSRSEDIERTR